MLPTDPSLPSGAVRGRDAATLASGPGPRAPVRALGAGARAATCALVLGGLAAVAGGQTTPGELLGDLKLDASAAAPAPQLDLGDGFGTSLAVLGDLGGDGTLEVAVGCAGDDDGGLGAGAVWIVSIEDDDTIVAAQKISAWSGGGPVLGSGDAFGIAVAALGDLDGDGVPDLAVGSSGDDDGGGVLVGNTGAVWILFLAPSGAVASTAKISATSGGLVGPLDPGDEFGISLAALGDLDGDGLTELAVGASKDDDGAPGQFQTGAVHVLFLGTDGTVVDERKVSAAEGVLAGALDDADLFGRALAGLGDVDGDGVPDLAVGACNDDDGGTDAGAVWILFLDATGGATDARKLSATESEVLAGVGAGEELGAALGALAGFDLFADGVPDLVIGAPGGGGGDGAVWVVALAPDGTAESAVAVAAGALGTPPVPPAGGGPAFGSAVAAADLDGDGTTTLLVGARGDTELGWQTGALWNLSINGSSWIDLGGGLAGTNGIPQLSGSGALTLGTPVAMNASGVLASAPTFLFFGITVIDAPFFGGTLVPSPDIIFPGILTDGEGNVVIADNLPVTLPPGVTFFIQLVIDDAGAVEGVALSNALRIMAP